MLCSFVVPAHNEAITIKKSVIEFILKLNNVLRKIEYEIIIIENGSTDNTLQIAQLIKRQYPVIVNVCSNKRGSYGEAIKRGIAESNGKYIFLVECDLFDVDFILNSLKVFKKKEADIIIGSKLHPQSFDQRPFKRILLTKVFNILLNIFTKYPGTDTHGLKGIRTDLANKLCQLSITTDEVFQTEIVLMSWCLGKRIVELPMQIKEIRAPSVSIIKRLPMILNLFSMLHRSMIRFTNNSPKKVHQKFI